MIRKTGDNLDLFISHENKDRNNTHPIYSGKATAVGGRFSRTKGDTHLGEACHSGITLHIAWCKAQRTPSHRKYSESYSSAL